MASTPWSFALRADHIASSALFSSNTCECRCMSFGILAAGVGCTNSVQGRTVKRSMATFVPSDLGREVPSTTMRSSC